MSTAYTPNAGQTFQPFSGNIYVPQREFTPLEGAHPAIPGQKLNKMAQEKGWILGAECQHFLPGVTAKMLDWWWANMEKGYYLWAPGAHKRFSWVRSPGEVGFLHSAHKIVEAMVPGKPVFGGEGVQINRLDLSWFPLEDCLGHVIVEGVFNEKDELCDMTIHMWDDTEGGCNHYTCAVINGRCSMPPAFVLEDPESLPNDEMRAYHAEYEASQWPVFLPTLYHLWEGHTDPSQNIQCDLTALRRADGSLYYPAENGPVVIGPELLEQK